MYKFSILIFIINFHQLIMSVSQNYSNLIFNIFCSNISNFALYKNYIIIHLPRDHAFSTVASCIIQNILNHLNVRVNRVNFEVKQARESTLQTAAIDVKNIFQEKWTIHMFIEINLHFGCCFDWKFQQQTNQTHCKIVSYQWTDNHRKNI